MRNRQVGSGPSLDAGAGAAMPNPHSRRCARPL